MRKGERHCDAEGERVNIMNPGSLQFRPFFFLTGVGNKNALFDSKIINIVY